MHGPGWRYEITIEAEPFEAWRLLGSREATQEAFCSAFETKIRNPDSRYHRGWPDDGEDHILYRGISAWEGEGVARKRALEWNRINEEAGRKPKFSHLVRFMVNGHKGDASVSEGPPGHLSVFGDPRKLYLSAGPPVPI
jgi:hypothetical protein